VLSMDLYSSHMGVNSSAILILVKSESRLDARNYPDRDAEPSSNEQ
jgi:hypothetical protein